MEEKIKKFLELIKRANQLQQALWKTLRELDRIEGAFREGDQRFLLVTAGGEEHQITGLFLARPLTGIIDFGHLEEGSRRLTVLKVLAEKVTTDPNTGEEITDVLPKSFDVSEIVEVSPIR